MEAELCFDKAWDKIMHKHEVMHKEAKAKRGMVQEQEEEEEEERADAHVYLIGGVASFGSDRESSKQKEPHPNQLEPQPNRQQPFPEQMLWLSVAICAELIRLSMCVHQSATLPQAGFPQAGFSHAVCLVWVLVQLQPVMSPKAQPTADGNLRCSTACRARWQLYSGSGLMQLLLLSAPTARFVLQGRQWVAYGTTATNSHHASQRKGPPRQG